MSQLTWRWSLKSAMAGLSLWRWASSTIEVCSLSPPSFSWQLIHWTSLETHFACLGRVSAIYRYVTKPFQKLASSYNSYHFLYCVQSLVSVGGSLLQCGISQDCTHPEASPNRNIQDSLLSWLAVGMNCWLGAHLGLSIETLRCSSIWSFIWLVFLTILKLGFQVRTFQVWR